MKQVSKNKKYYNIQPILSLGCQYNLIIGERTNGKSFAVKQTILEDAIKHGRYFCYVRRWKDELKAYQVESYFDDFSNDVLSDGSSINRIRVMTNEKYETVQAVTGKIYLANFDEYGRKIRGEQIGYYFNLSAQTNYKSQSFPLAFNLVFEEFITTRGYLPNEPKNLLHLISTIFRQRSGRIFLIGNTINRTFPYLKEWGLTHVLTQKRGSIEVYTVTDGSNEVKIAVEITDNKLNNNHLAFGHNVSSITNGEWEVESFLHLEKPVEQYKKLYILFAISGYMIFRISLIEDEKQLYLYIDSWNDKIPPKSRVVQNIYNCDRMYTRGFNEAVTIYDKVVYKLLQRGKFKAENDLVGTDFCSAFGIK